jgi:hypothetical protein
VIFTIYRIALTSFKFNFISPIYIHVIFINMQKKKYILVVPDFKKRSVDPDQTAQMLQLIWIYTVGHGTAISHGVMG